MMLLDPLNMALAPFPNEGRGCKVLGAQELMVRQFEMPRCSFDSISVMLGHMTWLKAACRIAYLNAPGISIHSNVISR